MTRIFSPPMVNITPMSSGGNNKGYPTPKNIRVNLDMVVLNASPLVVETNTDSNSLHLYPSNGNTFYSTLHPSHHLHHNSWDGIRKSPLMDDSRRGSATSKLSEAPINTTSLAELQFASDKASLLRAKQQTHSPVHLHFRHLSVDSVFCFHLFLFNFQLGEALELSPAVLVLNGHGTYSQEGDFVFAFEANSDDGNTRTSTIGSSDLFTLTRLRILLTAMPKDKLPSLVFLNMCYSEHAAEVFSDCGVPHVIACRKGMKVMDKAARYFSKHLFTALFNGQTIQRAFDVCLFNICSFFYYFKLYLFVVFYLRSPVRMFNVVLTLDGQLL